jgi:hypothetical protein
MFPLFKSLLSIPKVISILNMLYSNFYFTHLAQGKLNGDDFEFFNMW